MKLELRKYLTTKTLIISSISTLLIIFLIQNADDVSLKFWFWKVHIPLSFLILTLLLLGGLITYILLISKIKNKSTDTKELIKNNNDE